MPHIIAGHILMLSLAASSNLNKTNSSVCGSSELADVNNKEDDIVTLSLVGEACSEASGFYVEALLSWSAVAGVYPLYFPTRASALAQDYRSQRQVPLPVYHDFVWIDRDGPSSCFGVQCNSW